MLIGRVEHLRCIETAVGADEISIERAVETFTKQQRGAVVTPQQGIGNAQTEQQRCHALIGIDSEQATGTAYQRQILAVLADVVLHGAQPQAAQGIATGFVGAVARLRVGDAEQRQAWLEAGRIEIEPVDTTAQCHQRIAAGARNEGGDVLGHLPDLHVLTDQAQRLLTGDIDPVKRLGRSIPERAFAEFRAVLGQGGERHIKSF